MICDDCGSTMVDREGPKADYRCYVCEQDEEICALWGRIHYLEEIVERLLKREKTPKITK